ncbi:alcohol oxidase [Dentipellis sp. KUC8613]|nr:alcohol oxidase [Dentipellis sp. KUC8613]
MHSPFGFAIALGTLFAASLAGASSQCQSLPSAPSAADARAFSRISFDYIVVGGGTAGLTVASRLAETPNVQVGVLEAGFFHQGDPLVDVPGDIGLAQGNASYDWAFSTVPQSGAAGRQISQPRGKMLGGSSGLNLLAWNRPSKPELDAWDHFAPGTGWNWTGLLRYMMKAESIMAGEWNPFPGLTPQEENDTYDSAVDGTTGPIRASLNVLYPDNVPPFVSSLNNVGISTNPNADAGNTTGVYNTRTCIDRSTGTRSYAAQYYCRSSSQSNFHVLTNSQVTKIVFKPGAQNVTATGVRFVVNGQSYVVDASTEVILAAGTVQTPQILELSGIGNRTILDQAGVQTLVNLPGVGENLQEHLFAPVQYQLNSSVINFDTLRINASFAAAQAAQYSASHTGWLAASDSAFAYLPFGVFVNASDKSALISAFNASTQVAGTTPLQALQYEIQAGWLQEDDVPQVEVLVFSKGLISPADDQVYTTLLGGFQHPVARGSIHINSSNPLAYPVIDGNYLDNDYDVLTIVNAVKLARRVGTVAPFSNIVVTETNPPPGELSDADLINWVRTTANPGSHLIGTAAMAPKSIGGVVDGQLKVYGTTNVRVADASIMPLLIATHIQQPVFAIAEKLADILKQAHHAH